MNNRILGNLGEKVAKQYLEKKNYRIIQMNFLCKQGEIDIIAKDRDEYVFIEVKTRGNYKFGFPRDAVNEKKEKHIKSATKYFIYKNCLQNKSIRFDVIEVRFKADKYLIDHIKNQNLNL